MNRKRAWGLVARLYVFTAAQIVAVAFVLPWIARTRNGPPPALPETRATAAFVGHLIQDTANDPAARAALIARLANELHAAVSVYTPRDELVVSTVTPALPRREQPGERPHVPRVTVALDSGDTVVFQTLLRPDPPPHHSTWWVLAGLVGCVAASVWFARRFASPLAELAATARAFGQGDLSVRASLARADEFGDVARAFDEMAERVATMIRTQKQLLANVAHELRTPLSRIRVALDLAEEGDPSMARAALAEIAEDLDELQQLVSDVLDSARLERSARLSPGDTPLRITAFDVSELVARVKARFQSRHPDRVLEVDSASFVLEADLALLRRAVDNLLDNAAKYSDKQTPVHLRVRAEDDNALLEIEDHGIGIDASDLSHVGTPFFRTDRSRVRKTGGVGLGLSLARSITEAHDGVLRLESQLGVGTIVRLRVPLRPESRTQQA